MKTITHNELWEALPADARASACAAFWGASDEMSRQARPAVLSALANSLRFREKFLKNQPDSQKAALLLRRSNQADLKNFQGEFLRALLLADHGNMIEKFLEVQEIPHQGCILESDVPPSADSLRKGIKAIRAEYGDWNTCLYLAFVSSQDADEYWAALPAAIEGEGLDLHATLIAPGQS